MELGLRESNESGNLDLLKLLKLLHSYLNRAAEPDKFRFALYMPILTCVRE